MFPNVFLSSSEKLTCCHCSTEVYMKPNMLIEIKTACYGKVFGWKEKTRDWQVDLKNKRANLLMG